jgi:hypothetical protein
LRVIFNFQKKKAENKIKKYHRRRLDLMLVKIACTRHVLVNIAPNDKENPIAKNQERICNTSE